jgi:hypothetical protein
MPSLDQSFDAQLITAFASGSLHLARQCSMAWCPTLQDVGGPTLYSHRARGKTQSYVAMDPGTGFLAGSGASASN